MSTPQAPAVIRFAVAWVLALAALTGLHSCGAASPQVVLYVSVDEHVARPVVEAFQAQTGIRVLLVGDSEAKKTTGLVERIRAEKDNPKADVFWSSEIFMTIALADDGLLEPWPSSAADASGVDRWPAAYKDPRGRWHGFAARARVIAYAPQRVPPEQLPQTWMHLAQPQFRDRVVMADPRFGTTGGHLAAMKTDWDRHIMPGYYEAFMDGLAENHVRILAGGNAAVVEAVARGEADLGMTDSDDVWAAQARGLDVKCLYPAHRLEKSEGGAGTLLIPNTAAKVTGGPNPGPAGQLMQFLLSERVERMLAESTSRNIPLRPGLARDFPELLVPDPLRIDYAAAARIRTAAVETAMRILTDPQKRDPPKPGPRVLDDPPERQAEDE